MSNSEITDEELASLRNCASVELQIANVLEPLSPRSRARVMRGVLAMYGYPLPAAPELLERDGEADR